ncbi:MAG: type IV pilus modification protein PilV [Pseudomonadales bacterium]|nr:type IV pilus modification protein PilV [Pseudomonadales bacterium]
MSIINKQGFDARLMQNAGRAKNSGQAKNTGFSMIELLVAVLIMGVGVLGITGLQVVSLQNNGSALLRGQAVQLSYEILDRIRANPLVAVGAVPGVAYGGIALTDVPAAPTNCQAVNCSEAQMVVFDIAVWKCSLGNFNTNGVCTNLRAAGVLPSIANLPGLPQGDGSIAVSVAGVITVTVQWQEANQPNVSVVSIDSQV